MPCDEEQLEKMHWISFLNHQLLPGITPCSNLPQTRFCLGFCMLSLPALQKKELLLDL